LGIFSVQFQKIRKYTRERTRNKTKARTRDNVGNAPWKWNKGHKKETKSVQGQEIRSGQRR